MKSISKFAFKPSEWKGEENSGEYMVQPDQTLSVREIFEKFKKGIPIDEYRRYLEYREMEHNPNYAVDDMDLMDELARCEERVYKANLKRNVVERKDIPDTQANPQQASEQNKPDDSLKNEVNVPL